MVTLKHGQEDGSQSPNYDDDYDEPQDYTMDDDDVCFFASFVFLMKRHFYLVYSHV